MLYFPGHDVVTYFDNLKFEIQSNNIEQQESISSESSFEEEISVYYNINIHPIQFTREKLPEIIYLFPHQPYYSIWLPPDKC